MSNTPFIEQNLDLLAQQGNLRQLSEMQQAGKTVFIDNQAMVNLSSNDYLGLASNIDLRQEFLSNLKAESFIPSASSSRLLTGNFKIHQAVESKLCHLYEADAALIFNSGYHANIGILPAISNSKTLIISDKLIHASIIDGIRLSEAYSLRYRHNDYVQLEKIIVEHVNKYDQLIIVTESIFSMDGDEADLNRLVALKQQYGNIWLYVDEAHAVGVRGVSGLGCAKEKGIANQIDFIVGTFGKAWASAGAFVICSETIKQYLINKMRPLIFSTALAPINWEWTLFILNHINQFYDRRERLIWTSRILRDRIQQISDKVHSSSHIIPFMVGGNQEAIALSQELRLKGFYILPVRPPAVPEGTARLRISLTADITIDEVNRLSEILLLHKNKYNLL